MAVWACGLCSVFDQSFLVVGLSGGVVIEGPGLYWLVSCDAFAVQGLSAAGYLCAGLERNERVCACAFKCWNRMNEVESSAQDMLLEQMI